MDAFLTISVDIDAPAVECLAEHLALAVMSGVMDADEALAVAESEAARFIRARA